MSETKPKIKVMLICLTRRGGLLQFNDCLADSLCQYCDVALICAQNAEHQLKNPSIHLYPLDTGVGVKGTVTKLFDHATWQTVHEAVSDFKPDIVHVTSAQEWNPVLGLIIKNKIQKPMVYTIHDVIHHEGTPAYFRLTESIFRKMPDYFVVLTEEGKQIICGKGVAEKNVLVVPHGVYDFFTQYAANVSEEKEILFFGRIEHYKGLQILLEAVRPVFELYPDWRLQITGGGDLAPYQELLSHPNIHVTNRYVANEEVASIMQRAAIVALPYLSASQSGVIPTAFAFGKAVIATNVGGIPDVVRDGQTGLLIPPHNVSALTDALLKLISNAALRKSLGENGKRFADENLGWNAIARKHEAFYRSILAQQA